MTIFQHVEQYVVLHTRVSTNIVKYLRQCIAAREDTALTYNNNNNNSVHRTNNMYVNVSGESAKNIIK